MPINQELLSFAPQPSVSPTISDEVRGYMEELKKREREKRESLRDSFAHQIAQPTRAARVKAVNNAMENVTDPIDRRMLVEEIAKIAAKKGAAREKEYQRKGFGKRWIENIRSTAESLMEGGSGIVDAAVSLAKKTTGDIRDVEDIEFERAIESTVRQHLPVTARSAGVSQQFLSGASQMAPDMAAGLLAAQAGGVPGMMGYWTARQLPERMESYQEMGVSPIAAAGAGLATSAAEAGIEAINIDPFGITEGAGVKSGLVRNAVNRIAKNPTIRRRLSDSADILKRYFLESTEEPAQAGVHGVAEWMVSQLPETDQRELGDIPDQMGDALVQAMGPLAIMSITGGGGRMLSQEAIAKYNKRKEEVLEYDKLGKPPSRRKWKEWKLSPSDGINAKQRRRGVEKIAKAIKEREQVQAILKDEQPTNEQWERWGIEEQPSEGDRLRVLRDKFGIEEEVPAPEAVEPEEDVSAREEGMPAPEAVEPEEDISARVAAQQAAEAARPVTGGLLKEETGAMPIEGERLREPTRWDTGDIDTSTEIPEVDRRRAAAYGTKKPLLVDRIKDAVTTTWHYATRAEVHLPGLRKYDHAREFFRQRKADASIAKDEAIRTIASITQQLTPDQLDLFESALMARNLLASFDRQEMLRYGFKTREQLEEWGKKLDPQVVANQAVQDALNTRNTVVEELVKGQVERGLLPESALENTETYFHHHVSMIRVAKTMGGGGPRPTKKSYRKRRARQTEGTEGLEEKYDPNTSYIEAETEWIADALATQRKHDGLQGVLEAYSRNEEFQRNAEQLEVDIDDLVRNDESVDWWQAVPGNYFYSATTIPEKLAAQLQAGLLDQAEISEDDLRTVLAMGGKHKRYILPTELVDQLNNATVNVAPNWLVDAQHKMMKAWKALMTNVLPKRILPYQMRNFTGDMSPVFAADPAIMLNAPKATTELWKYHFSRLDLSPELRAARDNAVVSSGFHASEVSDVSTLTAFQHLSRKEQRRLTANPVELYKRYIQPVAEMRENVLRYAAFLTYQKKLKDGTVHHYAATNRGVVERLKQDLGVDAAAAKMARDLVGDYGNVTAAGEFIRNNLFPFWAFQEINLKRYPQLAINAVQAGTGRGRLSAVLSAAAMYRVTALYSGLWAYNNFLYPAMTGEDDESKLSSYDRANPHILLGRDPTGVIRLFRNVGALGDLLEWAGLNEAFSMWDELRNDQATPADVVQEMAKAPIEKIVSLLRPDIKGGFEMVTGQSLFPSPFTPRAVERDVSAADIFGIGDEYKWVKGKTIGRGNRPRPFYFQKWLIAKVDPRAAALSEMYNLRAQYLRQQGQSTGGVYPVSQYKRARDAAIAEDYDAFREWMEFYIKENPHKPTKKFIGFLKRLDPISSRLNDRDEWKFENEFLTSEQLMKLKVAREYSMMLRDRLYTWWAGTAEEILEKNRQNSES